MVVGPEVGQGIKIKTDGMVRFQEILQETVFIRNLLWKKDQIILWAKTRTNDHGRPGKQISWIVKICAIHQGRQSKNPVIPKMATTVL